MYNLVNINERSILIVRFGITSYYQIPMFVFLLSFLAYGTEEQCPLRSFRYALLLSAMLA